MFVDETTLMYQITHNLSSGSVTAAHFHGPSMPGANGGVLYTIDVSKGMNTYSGMISTANMSSDVLMAFLSLGGNTVYVNIHTTMYGSGEIRGDVMNLTTFESSTTTTESPSDSGDKFYALLSGDNQVPAVGSMGSGTAALVYEYGVISVYMTVANLQGNITGIHIHLGDSATNGAVIVVLPAMDSINGTFLLPLNYTVMYQLYTQGLYINVHTTAYPNGEIRGQIMQTDNGGMIDLAARDVSVMSFGHGTGTIKSKRAIEGV
jgi:hypothetical protein